MEDDSQMLRNRMPRLALIGVLALSMIGGTGVVSAQDASPAAEDCTPYTVGVTVYNMSSFITLGKIGIDTYAAANCITIEWNSANDDVNTQISQMQQLIGKQVDAIIIVPVDASTLGPQVQQAKDAGIPVIAVNTGLIGDAAALLESSVLPDDVLAGEAEMQQLADLLGGKGKIVVLQGPLGSSPEINRTQGINNVLAKYPDIEVLAMDTANWARDQAYNKMKSWVSAFGPEIDGFVSENDDMAIGGHQALAEAGIDIPITGIDGIQDGLQGVLDGWLNATNLQNGILELAEGLAVTKLILDGQPYEKEYWYVMPPVTDKETAQKYYDQIFGDNAEFLAALPALVDANVASGDLSNQ
jgi:ribose transport system substrate-binding protein